SAPASCPSRHSPPPRPRRPARRHEAALHSVPRAVAGSSDNLRHRIVAITPLAPAGEVVVIALEDDALRPEPGAEAAFGGEVVAEEIAKPREHRLEPVGSDGPGIAGTTETDQLEVEHGTRRHVREAARADHRGLERELEVKGAELPVAGEAARLVVVDRVGTGRIAVDPVGAAGQGEAEAGKIELARHLAAEGCSPRPPHCLPRQAPRGGRLRPAPSALPPPPGTTARAAWAARARAPGPPAMVSWRAPRRQSPGRPPRHRQAAWRRWRR